MKRSAARRAVFPISPGGESKGGGRGPHLGRFKGMGLLREGGNRNPPSLERVFRLFLHEQKETGARAAQARKESKFALRPREKEMGGAIGLPTKANAFAGAL